MTDRFCDTRWITNSAEAGIFLVFANVDPSKGYKGITCFALDKEMGVTIAKKEKKVRCGNHHRVPGQLLIETILARNQGFFYMPVEL